MSEDLKDISSWINEEHDLISSDDFFLSEEKYPQLYEEAKKRHRENRSSAPIEQLTPVGMALLSYLYSKKDQSEIQPVIASNMQDIKHVLSLMPESPIGTKITMIFFIMGHKSVYQLRRTEKEIQLINLDSIGGVYRDFCRLVIRLAFEDKNIKYTHYRQKQDDVASWQRQKDKYQCGVFAFKDARHINRDENFLEKTKFTPYLSSHYDNLFEYEIPPLYLKGVQSTKLSEEILSIHGDQVVTRKGATLRQVYEKHRLNGYIQHFSQKYHDMVKNFVADHLDQPEKIKKAVQQYHAGSLTSSRLAHVYGPKTTLSTELNLIWIKYIIDNSIDKSEHMKATSTESFPCAHKRMGK